MKKIILLIVGLVILTAFPLVSAISVETGTVFAPSDSSTEYTFGATLALTNFSVRNDSFKFDNNLFCIEPATGTAAITINNLSGSYMSFNVTATDNTVFTLGNFTVAKVYDVLVDGASYEHALANSTGVITFSYNMASTHVFLIIPYTETGGGGGAVATHGCLNITIKGESARIYIYYGQEVSATVSTNLFEGRSYDYELPAGPYTIKAVASKTMEQTVVLYSGETSRITFDFTEEDKGWSIPGFELLSLIVAIGVAFIILRKRR